MNFIRLFQLLFLITLTISGFWYSGNALTGLLLIVATIIAFNSSSTPRIWRDYLITKPMLAYLVWLFIVAYSGIIQDTSILMLASMAGMPVVYLIATNIPSSSELWDNKTLYWLLFITALGLAIWAILQIILHIGYGQAVGPLADRNAFAALLNLLWFPTAYLFLSYRFKVKWKSTLIGLGLFCISVALFATSSRGGIATWLLLTPILLWATYINHKSKRPIVCITFITILAYLCSSFWLDSNVANRTFELALDPSASARFLIWKSSIQMILAHPFTGSGWGTFGNFYPAYRSPLENSTSGYFAHNDYLQLATEGGLPMLLLQLSVLAALLIQLKHSWKRVSDAKGFETIILSLGVLAMFIHAAVNFIFCYAFINILLGLYLARVSQLTEIFHVRTMPSFPKVRSSIKQLFTGFVILLIASPFCLHLISQLSLMGNQPGLKAINSIAPNVTAYDLARFITAINPKESIAQEIMLQASEHALADSEGINMEDSNFQARLLNETLERFDSVRVENANLPQIGVREVKILMKYHTIYDESHTDGTTAYSKAYQILKDNLKVDPYHANSMIALSRLQVVLGRPVDALFTLQRSKQHVLSRRDHQLIDVEGLRQLAAPKVIAELDDIEKQLRQVRSESETGQPLVLPEKFSEHIDERLHAISVSINSNK